MMASATRVILTVIAACVAAIATKRAVLAICDGASCEGYSLGAAAIALAVVCLLAYFVVRRTSASENERDIKKTMAVDTATGGGEFGDGDGGGD